MRRNKVVAASVVTVSFLCIAAASALYVVMPAVVDSGGGKASSSSYQLDCSIGGPVIATGGTASSASYKLEVNAVGMLAESPDPPPVTPFAGGCVGGGSSLAWLLPLGLLALARRSQSGRPAKS